MSFSSTTLITGGTSGLGLCIVQALAEQKPDTLIVVLSRSDKEDIIGKLNQRSKSKNVRFLPLDLAEVPNVRAFAEKWQSQNFPPIKTLYLNAALQFPGPVLFNKDGIEKTFAITHLGNAALFHLLVPYLTKDARIIVTSSGTHDPAEKWGTPEPVYVDTESVARPNPSTATTNGRVRYTTAKLTNVLWAHALQRRLNEYHKGMTVAAVDPGLMPATGLIRDAALPVRIIAGKILPRFIWLLHILWRPEIFAPSTSAAYFIKVADNSIGGGDKGGVYYTVGNTAPKKSSELSYDEAKQEQLFHWTTDYIGRNQEEKAALERLSV